MGRSLWLAFALAALWLWASLAPQVTYPTASSGEAAGDVLIAWPGWAVQQDLGPVRGTIGRFQIRVSSALDAGEISLHASLVDASTNEVLRQTAIDATPSYTPVGRTLIFPGYVVPDGQRLLLQLEVAAFERRPVIYGLAHAQSDHANLALNGIPDAGSGPLAFTHQGTGSGLRAALHGQPDARIRLILALVITVLAVLAHPRVVGGLRRASGAGKRLSMRAIPWRRRLGRSNLQLDAGGPPTGFRCLTAAPWYPWPVALIPVLHFLASNPLHFSVREAIVPAGSVLLIVTLAMAGLRLVLKRWHQAAAAVSAVAVIIFAYGHVERALNAPFDDQVLFPTAATVAAAAVVTAVRSRGLGSHVTPFLNLTASTLLLLQIINVGASSSGATVRTPQLFTDTSQRVGGDSPDIYHIVLDAYGRHDTLREYDNSGFLKALEDRGFYVAREATSNYRTTIHSLASSLNLAYLHEIEPRPPKNRSDAIALVQSNALAATLKSLGYTYVFLESGHVVSNQAPQADIFVTFTPAGVVVSSVGEETRYSPIVPSTQAEGVLSGGFLRALIDTTALRPLSGNRFLHGDASPYDWWSPERTLQMFALLSEAVDTPGPKFVFAHIIKPHPPATFDRHGNTFFGQRSTEGFSDTHDSAVPNAYTGQLIYINSLVLKMIDKILDASTEKPIIVITADHGLIEYDRHAILAAFHLPNGGDRALYPSISSVNHFRAILDYYFDLKLGLLEDLKFDLKGTQFELPSEPTTNAASR